MATTAMLQIMAFLRTGSRKSHAAADLRNKMTLLDDLTGAACTFASALAE